MTPKHDMQRRRPRRLRRGCRLRATGGSKSAAGDGGYGRCLVLAPNHGDERDLALDQLSFRNRFSNCLLLGFAYSLKLLTLRICFAVSPNAYRIPPGTDPAGPGSLFPPLWVPWIGGRRQGAEFQQAPSATAAPLSRSGCAAQEDLSAARNPSLFPRPTRTTGIPQ